MTQILHVTPHLGGGVGKALSGLIKQSIKSKLEFEHSIVCLETPEKRCDIDRIIEAPSIKSLEKIIEQVDIVQIEYWNHPLLIKYLCEIDIPQIRLICWSHNNGLFNPIVPIKLILDSHNFIFTSECSFERSEIKNLIPSFKDKLGVVYASGGFDNNDETNKSDEISVGYIGSTVFSKMHPDYTYFINILKNKVKIIGDLHNKDILEKRSSKLDFRGFVPDITKELKTINILAYFLNPYHYGTTENALLETMNLGIVPIILNNQAEQCIVKNGITGFIINSPTEYSHRISFLSNHPDTRKEIGLNAMNYVRENFSVEKTESGLNKHYKEVLSMEKRKIDFKSIFGNTPEQWFLSCQSNKEIFKEDGSVDLSTSNEYSIPMLFEESKGSVFHFAKYFPENERLKQWSKNLKLLQ